MYTTDWAFCDRTTIAKVAKDMPLIPFTVIFLGIPVRAASTHLTESTPQSILCTLSAKVGIQPR